MADAQTGRPITTMSETRPCLLILELTSRRIQVARKQYSTAPLPATHNRCNAPKYLALKNLASFVMAEICRVYTKFRENLLFGEKNMSIFFSSILKHEIESLLKSFR